MSGRRGATELGTVALVPTLLVAACTCASSHVPHDGALQDSGSDAQLDATSDAARDGGLDAGPVDADHPDAYVGDGGVCAPVPAVTCPGGYFPRGSPLDVTGALPYFAHRTCDGWAWITTGETGAWSSRVVSVDRALTRIETTPVEGVPFDVGAQTYAVADASGFRASDGSWLFSLGPFGGSPADHVAMYGLDGALRSPIAPLSPLDVRDVVDTDAGFRFLAIERAPAPEPGCASVAITPALLREGLALESGPTHDLGVIRLGPTGWRGGGWLGFSAPCADAEALEVWTIAEDGRFGAPRAVTGLPPTLPRSIGAGSGIFPEGPLLLVGVDPTTAALELVSIDPERAVASMPSVLARPAGRVTAGRLEREGDSGFALLYQEVDDSGSGTQTTRLLRFTLSGEIIQHTTISTGAAFRGSEPFLLRFDGDMFIAGYTDRRYVVDALVCARP